MSELQARFWAKVKKGPGCWNWQAGPRKGYGVLHLGSRYGKIYVGSVGTNTSITAHRFSWIIENGLIPDGMWVLHHCDNPRCVSPGHLFLGTPADNAHDMISKGRRWQNYPEKLTKDQVREIHQQRGLTAQILAREFKVSRTTIYYIWKGKTYLWVKDIGPIPENWKIPRGSLKSGTPSTSETLTGSRERLRCSMARKSRGTGKCEVCEAEFEDSGHGSKRKYCSKQCRLAAFYGRKIARAIARETHPPKGGS